MENKKIKVTCIQDFRLNFGLGEVSMRVGDVCEIEKSYADTLLGLGLVKVEKEKK